MCQHQDDQPLHSLTTLTSNHLSVLQKITIRREQPHPHLRYTTHRLPQPHPISEHRSNQPTHTYLQQVTPMQNSYLAALFGYGTFPQAPSHGPPDNISSSTYRLYQDSPPIRSLLRLSVTSKMETPGVNLYSSFVRKRGGRRSCGIALSRSWLVTKAIHLASDPPRVLRCHLEVFL